MGRIHGMECFIPEMIKAGRGGHLVNVSSAAGLFGLPFHAAYSASKFGLGGISEVLRFDLKRHGIGGSLVCPGGVNTGLVKTVEIRAVGGLFKVFCGLANAHIPRVCLSHLSATLFGIRKQRFLCLPPYILSKKTWAPPRAPPPPGPGPPPRPGGV